MSFLRGFELVSFPGPHLIPLKPIDVYIDVFAVDGEGFLLPHIREIQQVYLNTSKTRAHLANPETTEFLDGEIISKPIHTLSTINYDLWRKGSNMTLAVFNALSSLVTHVTRPFNFLFDPARRLNKIPYLGTTPEKIMCNARVTIQDETGENNVYTGSMPAGMFVVLMTINIMATTPVSTTNIWGSTTEFAQNRIVRHVAKSAKDIFSGISFEPSPAVTSPMLPIETMVLLSQRVARMVQVLAELVQTPEPIPPHAQVAQKCPVCSAHVSTATPRSKLMPSDEEFEQDSDEMIGAMRLLKIPIKFNTLETSRHIYICPRCNDDTRPLRFVHLSKNPVKRKREKEPDKRPTKRRGAKRLQTAIERKLSVIDFVSSCFLPDEKQEAVRLEAETLRQALE